MDDLQYLTIRQVARTGLLSENALRRLLANHRLPGFYVGTHYKVDVARLKAMLEAIAETGDRLI